MRDDESLDGYCGADPDAARKVYAQRHRHNIINQLRQAAYPNRDLMVEAMARNWGVPCSISDDEYDAVVASARGLLTESDGRPCSCGSDKPSRWFKDARQIELFRGCDDCAPDKLKRYRPDVLVDPNYWADEPIDEE